MNSEQTDYKNYAYIETFTGQLFSLEKPEFDTRDIAHALSLIGRYNGHSNRFYSVAEHSVLVSGIMAYLKTGNPFEGLMHDGTEAYLSDVPAPFKQYLPDWQAIDTKLEAQLRADYGLPAEKTAACKFADRLALFIEAYDLLPTRGESFMDLDGARAQALKLLEQVPKFRVRCLSPLRAEQEWLTVYDRLTILAQP